FAFSFLFPKNEYETVVSDAISAEIVFLLIALVALRWLAPQLRMRIVVGVLALELGTSVLINWGVIGIAPTPDEYRTLVESRRARVPLDEIERPRFNGGYSDLGCGRAFVEKRFCAGEYNPGRLAALDRLLAEGFGPWIENGPRVVALSPGDSPRSFEEF